MFHAPDQLLEPGSSSDQKGADEQAAAGDLFPPIYSAAFPERES